MKVIGFILGFFLPRLVHACSVCFSGTDAQLNAYYYTTALLTLLPLGVIFGFIFWLFRRYNQHSLPKE